MGRKSTLQWIDLCINWKRDDLLTLQVIYRAQFTDEG